MVTKVNIMQFGHDLFAIQTYWSLDNWEWCAAQRESQAIFLTAAATILSFSFTKQCLVSYGKDFSWSGFEWTC